MAEDEAIFDPTMKKKKKKKKMPFDLDAALSGEAGVGGENEANEDGEEEKGAEDGKEDAPKDDPLLDDDFSLENLSKKKKKKKKVFDMSELDENLPDSGDKAGDEDGNMDAGDDFDLDLSLPKKKKKKKKGITLDDEDEADEAKDDGIDTTDSSQGIGQDSDRDYTYDELLKRVFDIMREKNPDIVAGEKKRFVMKPPQVMRIGTKKSSFSNFAEICKMLHRQPKHLLAYLLAELGTSGSIDGNNQLIIKGRFQQKQIENVLRRYIKEYVTCHTCKSPDTILQKDTRLYFLQCETCGSRCSVASIKSGYQAVTNKRAAIRAKTA